MRFGYQQKLWIKFCHFFVRSFYSRVEISGAERLDIEAPIILCANHTNALADAVLLQYSSRQLLHPIARSGLFKNPLLKPILAIWQAVPVYRREDTESAQIDNHLMFKKAYEMLAAGHALMIFPEGQSHSGYQLKPLKTGAARIAIGFQQKYKITPVIIPVGLNFSQTDYFRSHVYINFGEAVAMNSALSVDSDDDVNALTDSILKAMQSRVIVVDQDRDYDFIKQLDRFYALRNNRIKKRSLSQKFKSHKLIISLNTKLSEIAPDKVISLQRHLNQFNRLCHHLGIHDYHLNLRYNSATIRRFIIRSVFMIAVIFPLALFGFINSVIPYALTKASGFVLAKKPDQQDTAKILSATLFFSLFWFAQSYAVYELYGGLISALYFLTLLPTSLAALILSREKQRITANLSVFFILLRRKYSRRYLLKKRRQIEKELTEIINLLRKH
ncbi:MAG: 1-acyl-sn-glycerol-3-phosphate acyltransferase [Gammaproteobacteria bacterium]|nr:1-acyl-sn-glycerol-3-phosphate acyltransferase [Gammaproteobacteria bacterium]